MCENSRQSELRRSEEDLEAPGRFSTERRSGLGKEACERQEEAKEITGMEMK